MIQQKVDHLFLLATAAALQMAVLLLKWMRRSETGNAQLPRTETESKAIFPV